MDYIVYGILQARILEWVAFPFSTGSSQSRNRTQVSFSAGGFFTNWATRKAQEYTRVHGLSLLQWIFPTLESNQSLLHCRWILHQLSYQGSPFICLPIYFWWHCAAWGILFPQPGIKPRPCQWKCQVPTTGPSENCLKTFFNEWTTLTCTLIDKQKWVRTHQ